MTLSPSAHLDTFCRDHLPPPEQWPEFLFDLPDVRYPERLSVATVLLDDAIAAGWGERPCLVTATGESWTYADLLAKANQVARVLTEDLALVPGNRVLLRGPNNPWLVAAWFGVLKAGGVVVPTMPLLRARELTTIGEVGRFSIAICDARFLDELAQADLPGLTIIPYGGEDATDLTRRAAGKSAAYVNVDTAADDVSMLAFTSGTTGRPKATMHFHRDVLANADTFGRHVLKPLADDVFIGTPPIAFTFGLGGLVIFPLRVGASTVLLEKATPMELAQVIADRGGTVCFTAPTAYKAMIAGGAVPQLRTLRRAVSAGEHLPLATWEAVRAATGLRLIDGIGSTEMLHIFIGSSDDEIRPGSTGRPVPGYRARIIDADGQEVPDGQAGRLAVQGPTGCRYLDDARQLVYVEHGWNVTGDTFIRDADGYFWYQARSDDMIISSGYNISGPEVEEAISTHPAVLETAVVASPDEDRGAIVRAFVVLKDGLDQVAEPGARSALMRSIQDHVKREIAPYKYPRAVEFVAALPRTSTGKVQRYVLRQQAASTAP